MKYVDTIIGFREVPDEISLCIDISECPIKCPSCHSKYLWGNVGQELNESVLNDLILRNTGISCVCLMGGDKDPKYISQLAKFVKKNFKNLKVCWYSGDSDLSPDIDIQYLDYYKLGPYDEQFGPLNNPKTNQRFYTRGALLHKMDANPNVFYDTTSKFWSNDSTL